MTMAPAWNNGLYLFIYLSIYLCCICMYHLYTLHLVPEICVCPEMLRVFWYIDVLTCMVYNCMQLTEQQGRLELLVSAVIFIDEDR